MVPCSPTARGQPTDQGDVASNLKVIEQPPPEPSAKALGKRPMQFTQVVEAPMPTFEEARHMAELGQFQTPVFRSLAPPPSRPPPDTAGDAALAAMLQAEADDEARIHWAQQRAGCEEDDDTDANQLWAELGIGEEEADIHDEFGNLDICRARKNCDIYAAQTKFLKGLVAGLDNEVSCNKPTGYAHLSNDTHLITEDDAEMPDMGDVPAMELTAEYLDNVFEAPQAPVVGVPVVSPYFSGINPFEPLCPSPTKRKVRRIKCDPDESDETAEADGAQNYAESLPCSCASSQEPCYESPSVSQEMN